MLYLNLYRAEVRQNDIEKIQGLKTQLGERFTALLRPMLDAAATVLGVSAEQLRRLPGDGGSVVGGAVDGEVFLDGKNLIVVHLHPAEKPARVGAGGDMVDDTEAEKADKEYELRLSVIGPTADPASLHDVVETAEIVLGMELEKVQRGGRSARAGAGAPAEPTQAEQWGTLLLQDPGLRSLATAIKSSGGLAVSEVGRQLKITHPSRAGQVIEELRGAGLVESEIVISCSKTGNQVTRVPNREVIEQLTAHGVKCACGKPLSQERMDEALVATDLGRGLLEHSRWLTVLMIEELRRLGISRESIRVHEVAQSDEMGGLDDGSVDRASFELKGKEFGIGVTDGGASDAADRKNRSTRSRCRVLVTTDPDASDGKAHSVRVELPGPLGERDGFGFGERGEMVIRFDEGVTQLRSSLDTLVSAINRSDAVRILDEVVPLASLGGGGLIRALEDAVERGRAERPRTPADLEIEPLGAVAGS